METKCVNYESGDEKPGQEMVSTQMVFFEGDYQKLEKNSWTVQE